MEVILSNIPVILGVLAFLGSIIAIYVGLTNRVEKIDGKVNDLIEHKNETLKKFNEIDGVINHKIKDLEIRLNQKFLEIKEDRVLTAEKLEKSFEKIDKKLDGLDLKLDEKFIDLKVLQTEHNSNKINCNYKQPTSKK